MSASWKRLTLSRMTTISSRRRLKSIKIVRKSVIKTHVSKRNCTVCGMINIESRYTPAALIKRLRLLEIKIQYDSFDVSPLSGIEAILSGPDELLRQQAIASRSMSSRPSEGIPNTNPPTAPLLSEIRSLVFATVVRFRAISVRLKSCALT